jgi:hypothetical protein
MLARMLRRLLGIALVLTTLASCKSPRRERETVSPPGAAIKPERTAKPATPAPSGSVCEPVPSTSATTAPDKPTASAAPPPPLISPLASRDVCHVARGPVQLPFTGPVTLLIGDDPEPRIIFNQGGIPRTVTIPSASKPPPKNGKGPAAKSNGERLALTEPAERATSPGCAAAGGSLFCLDKAGAIHKSPGPGQEGAVIAQARAGSPLAAAAIGGSHVVYAFLADRRTSEGATTLAFAGVDDAIPVTLSEDGAGATFVTLAPRGEEVIAMYIDARRVLTPVHARVLSFGAKLALGPDAVLFVGGGTEGRVTGVIAQGAPGSEHALVALDKDDKEYGMAAIRIEEQPRDDAPVAWSLYPGAIERAPLAATQGTLPVRVLRVRPASAEPKAKKVLELGELDAAGTYKPTCPVAEGSTFADPAIAVDRQGAVWIAYTDADGTWIERRGR